MFSINVRTYNFALTSVFILVSKIIITRATFISYNKIVLEMNVYWKLIEYRAISLAALKYSYIYEYKCK